MTSISNTKKNKHLTLDDRIEIQQCLDRDMTFKAIGRRIGKDQTTISKEVKKHVEANEDGAVRLDANGDSLAPTPCPELLKAPFVCNPCKKRHARCKYTKQFYHARFAQKEYSYLLSCAREGIPLNKESFYEMDRIVSEGVKKGQHLYHIMNTNNLGVSKSTVYRHLKRGYLSVSSVDFPRVVKFKARKQGYCVYVPKAARVGRTYDDFLAYVDEGEITTWVEMDTVIGRVGGKVIVTFDFTFCNFMFGLLADDKTALSVTERIKQLKSNFTDMRLRFGDIFPLILTDNGGEFANVSAIENDAYGQRETLLFFCDPYRSSQITRDTVNDIFSHVNSVKRKSLGGKTPFEIFSFIYGESIAKILGISPVPPEQVDQSPKLLEKLLGKPPKSSKSLR